MDFCDCESLTTGRICFLSAHVVWIIKQTIELWQNMFFCFIILELDFRLYLTLCYSSQAGMEVDIVANGGILYCLSEAICIISCTAYKLLCVIKLILLSLFVFFWWRSDLVFYFV
jgi:hypothetical protein